MLLCLLKGAVWTRRQHKEIILCSLKEKEFTLKAVSVAELNPGQKSWHPSKLLPRLFDKTYCKINNCPSSSKPSWELLGMEESVAKGRGFPVDQKNILAYFWVFNCNLICQNQWNFWHAGKHFQLLSSAEQMYAEGIGAGDRKKLATLYSTTMNSLVKQLLTFYFNIITCSNNIPRRVPKLIISES